MWAKVSLGGDWVNWGHRVTQSASRNKMQHQLQHWTILFPNCCERNATSVSWRVLRCVLLLTVYRVRLLCALVECDFPWLDNRGCISGGDREVPLRQRVKSGIGVHPTLVINGYRGLSSGLRDRTVLLTTTLPCDKVKNKWSFTYIPHTSLLCSKR